MPTQDRQAPTEAQYVPPETPERSPPHQALPLRGLEELDLSLQALPLLDDAEPDGGDVADQLAPGRHRGHKLGVRLSHNLHLDKPG